MFSIGIDPGLGGGIGIIDKDGQVVLAERMPLLNGEIDVIRLASIISHYMKIDGCFCVLEKVGAMPKMNVVSIFTFGDVVGHIKACLKILRVGYQEVTPQNWKKEVLAGLPWKVTVPKPKIPEGTSPAEKKEIEKKHRSEKARCKKESKLVACHFIKKRYPNLDIHFGSKNPHDGVAEALCMAIFAKKHC